MTRCERAPVITQPEALRRCLPLSEAPLSDEDAALLARQFSALGDPVRLALMSHLARADGGLVCACDLVEAVDRSQSTVSHHLRVLSDAGLTVHQRRGRNVWYGLATARVDALQRVLASRAQ